MITKVVGVVNHFTFGPQELVEIQRLVYEILDIILRVPPWERQEPAQWSIQVHFDPIGSEEQEDFPMRVHVHFRAEVPEKDVQCIFRPRAIRGMGLLALVQLVAYQVAQHLLCASTGRMRLDGASAVQGPKQYFQLLVTPDKGDS